MSNVSIIINTLILDSALWTESHVRMQWQAERSYARFSSPNRRKAV